MLTYVICRVKHLYLEKYLRENPLEKLYGSNAYI